MTNRTHRDTIYPEQAEILSHQACAGDQYILRVQAPNCAANALPGSFAHIQVAASRPLRRPISIMRTSARRGGWSFYIKRWEKAPDCWHCGNREKHWTCSDR